ncbi:NAD(P)/FAD-dependent oxidoreductase [Bacillus sp. SM2101]|uniref:NAD(P)/FAD-dependent oxidoreductase n=1 Tax=Bacillus sp. SM2101 TaxID=2805366 RepID=UPI001BDDF055|nr:NAD(P)/FAD-dependent oxidoreductase [Bacillus sp. SM2101]
MFDIIIVGARCAGSSLAIFLGRLGYKVLLIDKISNIGPTLSTHIIGEIDIYKTLNIDKEINNCGSPILNRLRIDVEGHIFESDLIVSERAISVRRELFDTYLIEEVERTQNISIQLGFEVTDILADKNGIIVGIEGKTKSNSMKQKFFGKIVVGADGRNSIISKKTNALTTLKQTEEELSVAYAYLSGVNPLPQGTIEWFWTKDSIILSNPIDQNMYCIAIMVPPTKFQEICSHHGFIKKLKHIKTLNPRINHVDIVGNIKGLKKIDSYMKHPYGEGWVLVGDSSAFLHPISGVGIDNAVCTAEYLAYQIDQFLSGKQSWEYSMELYMSFRDERITPQFHSSIKTQQMLKEPLNDNQNSMTSMICTFPSLAKNIALKSQKIVEMLQEDKDD